MPWGGRTWERQARQTDGQQFARIAMEELIAELMYAHRIEVNSAAGTLTYYKEKQGRLQRYRLYRLSDQLLLDLPEGTAVPLASCVEELSFYPAGKLKAGEVLTLTLQVKRQLLRPQLRSAVVAKNLSGEEA